MLVKINGIEMTREQAIIENMKLIKYVAHRYHRSGKWKGFEFSDLESIGAIGLIKAVDNFDDSLGYKFATYAVPKIAGEMQRWIRDANTGISYPRPIKDIAARILKHDLLDQKPEQIAEKFDVSVQIVSEAILYIEKNHASSLQYVTKNDEGKPLTIGDHIEIEEDFSNVIVEDFINSLPDREQVMVRMFLDDNSQAEVSKVIGVKQPQVGRLLHNKLKPKLAAYVAI